MKLKVISLNTWHNSGLLPQIIDFVKAESPDVLLLQEVYDAGDQPVPTAFNTMKVLRQQLGYDYNDFAQAFLYEGPHGALPHGNAIFSRLPIAETNHVFLQDPTLESYRDDPEHWPLLPSVLQHVELTTEIGPVNVYNLHGVWDLEGDSYSPARQKMSRIILEQTSDKPNVIVAGDTNAKSSNQAIRDLEAQLKPVFGAELVTTFNMRRKDNPGYATAAVDLMFVSPDIIILQKACPDVDISDHLPLVVTLQID